jgi:uncharacterized protein (DUF2062 family)
VLRSFAHRRTPRMQSIRPHILYPRLRAWLLRRECIRVLVDRPWLWRWSRRTVSRGAAVGVFIGILLPFGQIPAAAACAAYLRTHLPATVACTWITNPVTTIPVYYGIYLFGSRLLGSAAPALAESDAGWMDRIAAVGLPLLIGTPIVALLSIPYVLRREFHLARPCAKATPRHHSRNAPRLPHIPSPARVLLRFRSRISTRFCSARHRCARRRISSAWWRHDHSRS